MHSTHVTSRCGQLIGLVVAALLLPAVVSCGPTPAPTRPQGPAASPPDKVLSPEPIETPDIAPAQPVAPESPVAQPTPVALAPATGPALYAQHCAACHGAKGDGKGIAAAYLFPKPRDFRAGRFRLVSAASGVPSLDDLDAVLRRGMPGSAMPSWPKLTAQERKLLSEEVLRLLKEGLSAQFIAEFKASEGEDAEVDPQELAAFVQNKTTAPEPSAVPAFGVADAAAIARGKDLYVKQGCVACHGEKGKGDGQQTMVDAEGLPTRPRDFTLGIFKGGHDPASVFRRIALGMPGTPMPSSANLQPDQVQDLTHFTLSLSTEQARQAAILNRTQIVARHVAALPDKLDDPAWDAAPAAAIRMAPLWWRNDADPGLEVCAVHDGQSIAFRLRWNDLAADRHSAQTQAFKDGAALELYRGPAEPFVGMGGPGAAVDAWMWDADRQGPFVDVEDVYPRTVVDQYPLHEPRAETPEFARPGAKTANHPDVSLPARATGNQHARGQHADGGSTLTAAGPGSVTFRPRVNQRVKASGQWRGGKWSVIFVRPLAAAGEEEGIPLEPGGTASVAFALWDGAFRDRDGQKLISIWQDLSLEPLRK